MGVNFPHFLWLKPWLKRFEMYGNLPAALQHGTVVSASNTQNKRRSIGNYVNRIQKKNAGGGRNDSKYPKKYEQMNIYHKEVDK